MESTFKERLEQAITENGFKNGASLANAMNLPTTDTVYRLLRNDKNKPSFEFLQALIPLIPNTNINWLITGIPTSTSYKYDNTNPKTMPTAEPIVAYLATNNSHKTIPLVDARAAAGFGSAQFAITDNDIQAHYVVPDFQEINFMLRVVGNSMWPRYNSGDVVACRIVKNIQFIQWNKPYLIATGEQGLIIKRIMPTNDPALWELQSDNEAYPPFLINVADVKGLALIVGTIRLE